MAINLPIERRRRSSAAVVLAVLAVVALESAPSAAGNEFTIHACQADRANYSTDAFDDFATRGMMWKRACGPEGRGLRGLVTANVVRSGRVPRGARSYFVMRAPDGTQFARFTWSGQARRRDCRYALQLWASRPDGTPTPIKNVRANRGCPRPRRAQGAGWPRPRTFNIAGATSIVQRVICVGSTKKRFCSSRGLNYIRTFTARATVVDTSPPAVSIAQDNPFTLGEWVSGVQSVGYTATDNVGVRVARALVGGQVRGEDRRGCDYAQRVPCSSSPGLVRVDTSLLGEGTQPLLVEGEDAAGNVASSSHVSVRVDNTAPGAVATNLAEGDSWRNRNDFDVSWQNPDEVDRAPITAVHYRVCPADTGECIVGSKSSLGVQDLADLAVPRPGTWKLSLWRQDAAGNAEPANASVPVSLRYDPEPPALSFEPVPSSDPTLISVSVKDSLSGVASGDIEISRQGSNTWQGLATQRQDGRLSARIDDTQLPPGTYVLRATARDQAGNQNSTDRRSDGQPMVITLPLRLPTEMQAGAIRERTVERTIKRRGKRRRVTRRVTSFRSSTRVRFGQSVRLAGVLQSVDGQPIPNAEVGVLARSGNTPEEFVATLRTDDRGRYAYEAVATSSRVFRFVYSGTSLTLPSQREVVVLVRAASSIRARPKRLLNGETVTFTGHVRSLPVPAAGKLVELQVVLSGRWQTFRTTLAGSDGRWSVRYRFRRSCGLIRFRFRARLPAEAGYTFETGRTRAVRVQVQGRQCG
jgi:5-hydroxyisourate hydrolase-like protein (transthyretin family)